MKIERKKKKDALDYIIYPPKGYAIAGAGMIWKKNQHAAHIHFRKKLRKVI
jgi:hypothetical protein